jgi:hypothetical protein
MLSALINSSAGRRLTVAGIRRRDDTRFCWPIPSRVSAIGYVIERMSFFTSAQVHFRMAMDWSHSEQKLKGREVPCQELTKVNTSLTIMML